MSTSLRFPICLWRSSKELFTATVLDPPFFSEATAVSTSKVGCTRQIKQFLKWRYTEFPWTAEPEMKELEHKSFKVTVRPEYISNERSYPSAHTIPLKVHCVYGTLADKTLKVTIPQMAISFYCQDKKHLKELVTHYVRSASKGFSPAQLGRFLPAAEMILDEVVIRVPKQERAYEPIDYGVLEQIGDALGATSVRKRLAKPYGREESVCRLVSALEKDRTNVIVLGPTGCGKSATIVEAVRQIERKVGTDGQKGPKSHRYWMTSAGRLAAGMQFLGQWEERCQLVIDKLSSIKGTLVVENLLELVRVGGVTADASIAAFLVPYLTSGELHLVGEATAEELFACRRLLPSFGSIFQVIRLVDFTTDQATSALENLSDALTNQRKVTIDVGAVETASRLFGRFLPYEPKPGKAADFIATLVEKTEGNGEKTVTQEAVLQEFVEKTGLPEVFLRDELVLQPKEVYESLQKEVIGQEEPCRLLTRTVTTFKAGLNDPSRPIGVFLFSGPTGVGKTQLARTLSDYLFGAGTETKRLIRLDMSEYGVPGGAERMLMKPDGTPSDFVATMRQQPFGVVLFDEIEKAHPEVFDVLLSVLDEGRLIDPLGRLTSFQSAIIIMTSNLGATNQASIGFGEKKTPSYKKAIEKFFRPEFFNRIDAIANFSPLKEETIRLIVEKELKELENREGIKKRRLKVSWSNELVDHLAAAGFDERYGARPLQRTIEQLVIGPLARYLLENKAQGQLHIDIDDKKSPKFSIE